MSTILQSSAGHDREFTFTLEDFERVSRLIYEHAGISLSPSRVFSKFLTPKATVTASKLPVSKGSGSEERERSA